MLCCYYFENIINNVENNYSQNYTKYFCRKYLRYLKFFLKQLFIKKTVLQTTVTNMSYNIFKNNIKDSIYYTYRFQLLKFENLTFYRALTQTMLYVRQCQKSSAAQEESDSNVRKCTSCR